MAKETRQVNAGVTPPGGMNDNIPITPDPSYFSIQGLNSKSQLFLQRMEGKNLVNFFAAPVLGIHGDLLDRVYIETTEAIYMFEHITDAVPV